MSTASPVERLMLDLINQERTSRGLDPLALELRLNDASEDHSAWMDDTRNFSHTGVGGSNPGDRIVDAGFTLSGNWTWGENIAFQSERGAPGIADDVEDLHTALMNSPGHRANILNPNFELIGIGVEVGDGRGFDAVYVTQNFARTSAPVQIDSAPPPPENPESDAPSGTAGNDSLTGGAGDEVLQGGQGADTIYGQNGKDTIDGGVGADRIYGGQDNDRASGGAGNDIVFGGGGADVLFGGDGQDVLMGDAGNDTLNGGEGNDGLNGRVGNDRVNGGAGNDRVYGGAGNDRVYGGTGNDRVNGGAGNDRVYGGTGNDRVNGGAGNDRMNGGAGRDRLNGEAGNDIMTGGEGDDVFIFSTGRDVVRDFGAGDVIDLQSSAAITSFADLSQTGHLRQVGRDTVIDDLAGNTLMLRGIDVEDLQASDFLF